MLKIAVQETFHMPSYIKGNFEIKNDVPVEKSVGSNPEEKFERAALKRLGGSIAFVSKSRIAWSLEDEEKPLKPVQSKK